MKENAYILGIHDGHNCGATLSRGGKILASVNEERLTRTKNEAGYPRLSIEEVLRIGGVDSADLDQVAYASLFMHSPEHLVDLEPWYRVGIDNQRLDATKPDDYHKLVFNERRQARISTVVDHLGVDASDVVFVEHHQAHLAAAYYTNPRMEPGKPVLGLTCDGAGDQLAATVSICTGNEVKRIATTDRHASLGKIYSRVTMMMGMKPWEHEYKLMGLAPYADNDRSRAAAAPLRQLLNLSKNGTSFQLAGELSTNYCYQYLCKSFEAVRFDVIAGAVQTFTEDMLIDWVKKTIAVTGINDLVCGGGVFMNVKANMLIAALPEVNFMYVMPSASDESLSIGACLYQYYQSTEIIDHRESILDNLYLGGEHDRGAEQRAINEKLAGSDIAITEPGDVEEMAAGLIADGGVVARCAGRMEWGARALGNRSIVARADDYRTVDRINQMIKMRDFWMPFAPSILEEQASRYFDDPKNINPNFMTFAFPSKPDTYAHLTAGSHPRDRTLRPQVVTKSGSPRYHSLISKFLDKTGCGVVLNTSFNLHGFPIVNTPGEAIDVFLNSGLDHLALNNFVLSKPNTAP